MSILRNTVALLLVMLTVSSCDFLDEKMYTQKSDKVTSEDDAEMLVNQLYASGVYSVYRNRDNGWHPTKTMFGGLLSGLFRDLWANSTFNGDSDAMNVTFQNVGPAVHNNYIYPYQAIARANLVLREVPNLGLSPAREGELMGQAYFFRAFNYYHLIKEYGVLDGTPVDGGNGGVPLILSVNEVPDPALVNQPRAPIADVYQQIETDLLTVINGNLLKDAAFYSNGARVTKTTAQALLAIASLQWAGYPLRNTAKYQQAYEMANAVTENPVHALEESDNDGSDPQDQQSAFNKLKNDESSAEVIYAIEYSQPLGRSDDYLNYAVTNTSLTWNKPGTTTKVFKKSVMANMYSADDRLRFSYEDGDVRGMPYNFYFNEFYDPSTNTYYPCNEEDNWYWTDENALLAGLEGSLNFKVIRLAEMYLVAAEAYLGAGDVPNAAAKLDVVRQRAFKVGGTLNAGYTYIAAPTLSDILNERIHEMPLELKVWDDIRRTRLYPQQVSGTGVSGDPYILEWKDISLSSTQTWNKNDDKKFSDYMHYLVWPLSPAVLERNPKLSQNPGY